MAVLIALAALSTTAFVQWSGPSPGWAAAAFSFIGFRLFCDWLWNGAPAALGPHEPDIGRFPMIACATGFVANMLWLAAVAVGLWGSRRPIRTLGTIALGFSLASIVLLQIGVQQFGLRTGGYMWLAGIAILAFTRPDPPADLPTPTTAQE